MNRSFPRTASQFEAWRRRVCAWLVLTAALLIMYWVAWFAAHGIVASDYSAQYVSFEQSFLLADAGLLATALIAATQLWRRQASASLWLVLVGGAGAYLGALDVLYDLQHSIYDNGVAGAIELGINVFTLVSSIGVIGFAWFSRQWLPGGFLVHGTR